MLWRLSSSERLTPLQVFELAAGAHTLALEAGDKLLEAQALLLLGRTTSPSVRPEEALRALQRAEKIFVANGLRQEACICRAAVSRPLYDLGRERDALDTAQAAVLDPSLPEGDRAAAYARIVMCLSHLGELDRALQVAAEFALPAAVNSGQRRTLAVALRAQGMVLLHIFIQRTAPGLWRGVRGLPALAPTPTPATILTMLASAAAALPEGETWGYIVMATQVTLGISGPYEGPLEALCDLARASVPSDPLQAAWALYCKAIVLCHHAMAREALVALEKAIALAEPLGALGIVRDATLQQSRVYELLGDHARALNAYKRNADLRVVSLWRAWLSGDPDGAATKAASDDPAPGARDVRNLEPAHVRRAIRFIDAHLTKGIGVEDVAAHCKVGRRTLEVAFRDSRSGTLANYIRQRRLEYAASRLRLEDTAIADVARAIGYHSVAAFSRAFRVQFGMLPSDWKRERQDG